MLFKYKGITKKGKNVSGTVEASTIDEAKQKLKNQGIFYRSITTTREISLKSLTQKEMDGPLLSSFAKELSSYLNSGMSILTAIPV